MKSAFWLAIFAVTAAIGWLIWYSLGKWKARERAEEERLALFVAGTTRASPAKDAAPALPPVEGDGLAQQKLLFEAARKAGEADEPALAIQLYARLLARYPASTFAGQARAEVAAQKKKLIKA